MTFQELQNKIGTQNQADWSQHKNGGGWVHKTARIDATAYIGENAIIFSGNAQVTGNARVYGNAQVSGDAQVYGNAWVYGDAQVSGDARVSSDAWVKSPLFIIGSKHSLSNAKHGYIQIGCHCETYAWWKVHYRAVGRKNRYSPAEIKEYGEYIKLFAKVGMKIQKKSKESESR